MRLFVMGTKSRRMKNMEKENTHNLHTEPTLHYRSLDFVCNNSTSLKNFIPINREKLPTLFNFSENYYKLQDPIFTTIRSVNYNKEHEFSLNSIGWITLVRIKKFIVKVIGWKDQRICDINLELLKKDVAYPNFSIGSHEQFVYGLNQILLKAGYKYANNSKTTTKRIFYLERIGGKPEKW